MNHIVIHQISDFKVIMDSFVLITGSVVSKDKETDVNMWCLSFDKNALEEFSKGKLVELVAALVDKKKRQIAEMYNSSPATFYMWFDEMAAQLRFNIVSGHNVQLPFGCSVEIVDCIEPIVQELMASHYHEGISWSELELFEDEPEEDDEPYVLKVYVQSI